MGKVKGEVSGGGSGGGEGGKERKDKKEDRNTGTDLFVINKKSNDLGKADDKKFRERSFNNFCARVGEYSELHGIFLQCTLFVGAACVNSGSKSVEFEVVVGVIARGVVR